MKLGPRIILKLFLNFNAFQPQYSYQLYSYKKNEFTCFLFYKEPLSNLASFIAANNK